MKPLVPRKPRLFSRRVPAYSRVFYRALPMAYQTPFRYLNKVSGGRFRGHLADIGPAFGAFMEKVVLEDGVAVMGIDRGRFPIVGEVTHAKLTAHGRILTDTPIESMPINAREMAGKMDAAIASKLFSHPGLVPSARIPMLKGINFILRKGGIALVEVMYDELEYLPNPSEIAAAGFAFRKRIKGKYDVVYHLEKVANVH